MAFKSLDQSDIFFCPFKAPSLLAPELGASCVRVGLDEMVSGGVGVSESLGSGGDSDIAMLSTISVELMLDT